MLRAVCLALLLAALAGCGGDESRGAVNPDPATLPDGDARGATVITGAGCLACHTLAGNGTNGPGQDLTQVGARRTPQEIRRILLEGPLPMPDYSGMPAQDMDALVDYLAGLR